MSVISMTGRGTGTATNSLARVEVELSSVNRKSLDIAVSLPRPLASFEAPIQHQIQQALARGRISGEIRVIWTPRARAASVRVDESLARAHLEALRAAARKLGLPDNLQASCLLELPDVLGVEQRPAELDRLMPLIKKALAAALTQLQTMRRREGAALSRDLTKRLTTLGRATGHIETRAPGVAVRYREALLARLRDALPNAELVDDERMVKEMALFADRSDITEELVRLRSHLAQARDLLQTGGVIGRTLDFLVQEMGREINTIGAKANDGDITRRVIDVKAELERIREQVQNIE
ncbi:MAG: YicC/YloC family endoribonuclease [Kiritimatiellia bacterium]|jgi:uncharacterized protein (TIGR00255 family)|nr:YicC/YloC family endoribonuclease [Kiritimatiellia bacterium]